MKIGFIGIGTMGCPIALNLARNHVDLIVHDLNSKRHDEFVQLGIRATIDRADLASCQVIFLCLPNAEIVQEVLFGDNGMESLLETGKFICDLTTMDYMSAISIGNRLDSRGIDYLDAPVSGMQAKAIDGTLTIMCGGEIGVYETLLPLLKQVGRNVLYMGPQGCGQLSKTINNVLFDINIAALAELLPFAVKLGLNPENIGDVINSSSGGSFASTFFIPRILSRNFRDGYPMGDAYKDLVSCMNAATSMALPLPVTSAALSTYQMAMLQGLGECDKGAMTCVFEKLMGVEYKK